MFDRQKTNEAMAWSGNVPGDSSIGAITMSNPTMAETAPTATKNVLDIRLSHAIAKTPDGTGEQRVIICLAEDWPAIRDSRPCFATWSVATHGLEVIAIQPLRPAR
jgi:hypothetical protein